MILPSMRAGMFISLGCMLYIRIEDKVLASFLFALGLLSVGLTGSLLFTGQTHKLLEHTPKRTPKELAIIWAGNIAGVALTFLVAALLDPGMFEGAKALALKKLANPVPVVVLNSICCGMLMTMATRADSPKYVTIGCVAAFILAGFNHCIADCFYFCAALPGAIPYLLLITAGNTLGGLIPVAGVKRA